MHSVSVRLSTSSRLDQSPRQASLWAMLHCAVISIGFFRFPLHPMPSLPSALEAASVDSISWLHKIPILVF